MGTRRGKPSVPARAAAPAPEAPGPVRAHPEGATIEIKASPGARRTGAARWPGGELRVRLAAPAVEGKANAELIRWAAEILGVRPSAIEILRGERGTRKTLLLRGAAPAAVRELLSRIARETEP